MVPDRALSRRIGVVEVGSGAVRLLVADVSVTDLAVVGTGYEEMSLAADLIAGGDTRDAAVARVNLVVDHFRVRARQLGAETVVAFGTEAMRRQEDRDQGFDPAIQVLDARTEAICSMIAAVKGLKHRAASNTRVLMVDLGSGSLEIAVGVPQKDGVRLDTFGSFMLGNDVLSGQWRALAENFEAFRNQLVAQVSTLPVADARPGTGIALGSAATNFAWLQVRPAKAAPYNPRLTHGQVIKLRTIDKVIDTAIRSPVALKKYIDPTNADERLFGPLLTGALLLRLIFGSAGLDEFAVSGWGTRYGFAWLLGQIDSPRSLPV